jgi:hypothetical protein
MSVASAVSSVSFPFNFELDAYQSRRQP